MYTVLMIWEPYCTCGDSMNKLKRRNLAKNEVLKREPAATPYTNDQTTLTLHLNQKPLPCILQRIMCIFSNCGIGAASYVYMGDQSHIPELHYTPECFSW